MSINTLVICFFSFIYLFINANALSERVWETKQKITWKSVWSISFHLFFSNRIIMITLPSYHLIRPYYIIREETTYTYDKDDKASDTGLSSLNDS